MSSHEVRANHEHMSARAPTPTVRLATGQRSSLSWGFVLASGDTARVRCTTAAEGDFAIDTNPTDHPADHWADRLAERRQALVPLPWTWLRQVHGTEVVTVAEPGARAGAAADAAVTTAVGAALAIQAADCAPVALVADEGVVAAVHAGWRGLSAGVVKRAAGAVRRAGGVRLRAVVGPCIHACCYEFGGADLDRVAARYGDGVRATSRAGAPALDLPAAVGAALRAADAEVVGTSPGCTACGTPAMFSHRARGDTARQAMVVWLEGGAPEPTTP